MIWKPVVSFEGLYSISEYGDVKSLDREVLHYKGGVNRIKGKTLKTPLDRYGYKKVVLFNKGKRTYTTVHRQVAIAFIPNPNNLPEVNHKDSNKLNNHKSNLEWCTTEFNSEHAHENNLIDYNKISGINHYNTKLSEKDLKEVRRLLKTNMKQIDIARKFSTSKSAISRIKLGISYKK